MRSIEGRMRGTQSGGKLRGHIRAEYAKCTICHEPIPPGVKIRADVFRRAHGDALTVAQDWESWCREGLLDTVSPMDGGPADELRQKLDTQISPAGGAARMVPTYYPSLWRQTTNAEDVMDVIRVGREVGVAGFCLFRFDGRLIEMLALDKGETGDKK